jgi:hypothetical protein
MSSEDVNAVAQVLNKRGADCRLALLRQESLPRRCKSVHEGCGRNNSVAKNEFSNARRWPKVRMRLR